jgi:diaminohydroxyphosphoribosylaminopyrimidine deaminase/5-amino-6-(5-phosphoribosylamino)uracil reductase
VGCVLCDAEGRVLGQGHTQKAGGPHAEVMALRDAAAQGHSVEGATAYVTLEPCSHHGRTGPCCDALIAAGVGRVVASLADPNPLVAGQGFERLRAAGVEVEVGPGAAESRELNIGFFSRMVRKHALGAHEGGGFARRQDRPRQRREPVDHRRAARTDGHAWRARASAVLTGVGTVLEDNPRLDVRLVETPRQPHLVVVDSRLQTPPDAHIFIAGRPVWIYAAARRRSQGRRARSPRRHRHLPANADGKVDLPAC